MHIFSGVLVMAVIRKGKDVSDEITAFWCVMRSMYSDVAEEAADRNIEVDTGDQVYIRFI